MVAAAGEQAGKRRALVLASIAAVALVVTGVASGVGRGGGDKGFGTQLEESGNGPLVRPTIPQTPSGRTLLGTKSGGTRTFRLTASQFTQRFANFPVKTAQFWGYNGSTPGPTLIAYEGETIRVVLRNALPVPTTIHFHGMHQPNEDDGVAGISQPSPVLPGASHVYAFRPGHTGTFAYHSHTDGAIQELRGLDGFFLILPRREPRSTKVDVDVAMVLQEFAPSGEGGLVNPFPGGTGDFPFRTINGKTGDAAGGPITIHKGDRVRIRVYNASNGPHAMHLHGHDMVLVAKNGHSGPRVRQTTQNVAPGDFFELEFTATNPGNWIFHCHFPHHTTNAQESGWNGSPVGMLRIFHYAGYKPVPKEYFAFQGATLKAPLRPLNGSGVTGLAKLRLVTPNRVVVTVAARGAVPNEVHPQHVHRVPSGADGSCPPPSADTNGDGRISVPEGEPFYGPIALPLTPFPKADENGNILFEARAYVIPDDLKPLERRVVVLHGGMVNGSYDPTLPVACADLG